MTTTATAAAVEWYSDEAATFGDRLAAAREAAGLTIGELAGRIGVKSKVIEHWEADAKEPRANRLQMLAGLLGVSLMWLLTGEGDGVASPDEDEGAISADQRATLAEIREIRATMQAATERLGRLEKRLRGSDVDKHG